MFSHPLVMDHTPILSVSKDITKDSAKLQREVQPRWLRVRDNTDLISHYLRKLKRNQTPTRPDSIKCYIAVMELGSALQQALHPHRAALLKEEDPRLDGCPALLSPTPFLESSRQESSRQENSRHENSRQENSPSRQPQRPSTDSAELSASDSETETDSSEFMRLPSISSFDSALPMASRAQYPWVQHADPYSLHTHYAHHQHAYNHPIQNHPIQNHSIQNHSMLPFPPMQQPPHASSHPLDKRQDSPKQELVKQELVKQELFKQELVKQDSDPAPRFQQHSFIYHHQLDSKANKVPRKTPSPIKAPPQVPFLSPKPAGTPLPSSTPIHASRSPLSQEMPTKKRRRVRNTSGLGLVCEECSATETPEWRRGPNGSKTLCNACGLQYAKKIKREQKEREIRDQLERSSISFSAPVRVNTDVTLTAPNVVGRFDSLPMTQRHDLSSPSLSRHLSFASPSVAPQSSAKDFKASPSYTFHSHTCA